MKKIILLEIIIFIALSQLLFTNNNKNKFDEPLRKSKFNDFVPAQSITTSFPMPFDEFNNPINQPAISTGYYFVDSDDQAPDYWRPTPSIIDTTTEPDLWRRILPGPRLLDSASLVNDPDGLRFFRNPAFPLPNGDFFNGPTDSTDDAFAGPMPIGFDFYFNGLKYDSFYVSTNGIIALSNSRYIYDEDGNRVIPQGKSSCYNPMSMDWFYGGRGHSEDGLSDTTSDDFGYYYSVCGGNSQDSTAGIRARGGVLNQEQFAANKSALIAPFFGDLSMSQYNTATEKPEDWAKAFFKRSNNSDKLIIYFINMAPVRALNTPYGPFNGNFDLRPGDDNYLSASAQVILDKSDSSVSIVYERFDGVAVVSGRGVPAPTVFRYNTTVGVHGFARHTNYGQPSGEVEPWAGEYEQYTHYFSRYANPNSSWPHNYLAIKFKQWKNTLRVVDISYRVRKSDPNSDLDFTVEVPSSKANNYELLAGDERNGVIQPVAIIQNLTNEIQGPSGVNYHKQELNFRARFRIINEASLRIVYNRLVPVDSTCLALQDTNAADCTGDPYTRVKYVQVSKSDGDYRASELPFPGANSYNGIPPYGFVRVYFQPFEPNEFILSHIGRMRASITADPTNPETNESIVDSWPFDDTTSALLFVMKRLPDFNDDVTSYHIVNRALLPSTLKWVDIDAEVSSGDDVSNYPLPPRGLYPPTNNKDFDFTSPDFTRDTRGSPVIRMTRKTLDENEPATSPGGDELRSFPIDLRGKYGAVLSLSVQRTARRDEWPRGYADQELVGPEPRTLVNEDPFTVFNANDWAASSEPDELVVEFAKPSEDGINGITNIPDENWRFHPRRDGAKPVTNMPELSLFGAGGYMVGWLESDRDSALSPPQRPNLNGLRPDIFDDGIDFEFKKFFLPIPDTIIKAENEGAKNFRFRIKVLARNNKKCIACIPDDDDPYFIDNVKIIIPAECTDTELKLVKILWPYTIAPASQANKVPVRVKVSTNQITSPQFTIRVRIFKIGGDALPIYNRTINIPFISGRETAEIPMPFWNAGESGSGRYILKANLLFGDENNPDTDMDPSNDTSYTYVDMNFGDVFAYDPAENPRNDVPDAQFTGIPGRGLDLFGYSYGGMGNINGPSGGYDENIYGAGYSGGSSSGQIAMKFELNQRDTVYGYKAYFGGYQSFDDISLALYIDAGLPSTQIPGSLIYKFRGYDDVRQDAFWDEYVTYLLPEPVVLDAGTYWMAIGQLCETGFELGASKTRMGMRITSVSIPEPLTAGGEVGKLGYNLLIDKTLRCPDTSGHYVNSNIFAYRNGKDSSDKWFSFMPTIGNPGFAHLHHFGTSPADAKTLTLTRGTWIPLIRPYFGTSHLTDVAENDIFFNGITHKNSIELFWEASDNYNHQYDFYVQKRRKYDEDWSDIALIKGSGDVKSSKKYTYFDKNVKPNIKYDYRLRIVDKDGAMLGEFYTKPITLMLITKPELTIYQNVPNPLSNHTSISFTLPQESNVRLEIIDIFGNVVKTLLNSSANAGPNTVEWNALDDNNRPVASGSYIVRLIAGNDVRTMKMTVVR